MLTAPVAVLVSHTLGWEYDGDIGWWLVAAYSAPLLMLSEPFDVAIRADVIGGVYVILLMGASLLYWRARRSPD